MMNWRSTWLMTKGTPGMGGVIGGQGVRHRD